MTKGVLLLCLSLHLTGCLDQKTTSSSIVIPPGELIQLDLTEVNIVSESKYSLYIVDKQDEVTIPKTLLDLTSREKSDFKSQVMPKGITAEGALVAKITMEYRNTIWYSFILPGKVSKPNIDSSLTYQLLASYPNRKISGYSAEEITDITEKIKNFRETRMALFNIPSTFNPDLLYKFILNGLSNDFDFLTYLSSLNINFQFDSDGNITGTLYPFNVVNRAPVVDLKASTKLVKQIVKELSTLNMRATARDPDGDEIFFSWRFNDEIMPSIDNKFEWTPGYDDTSSNLYDIQVLISDGGKTTILQWDVEVQNTNRPPTYTANCPTVTQENQEFECTVSYSDLDGDTITASVSPIDGSNPVFVDGLQAPIDIQNKNSLTIKWTPNNLDAAKQQGSISVQFMDSNFGLAILNLNIKVLDNNSPPNVTQGPTPSDINLNPIEWDVCTGNATDGSSIPYYFYIIAEDPNNTSIPPAIPEDIVTLTYGGTLRSDIALHTQEVTSDKKLKLTYAWRPNPARLTGTWSVAIKDNHAGVGTTRNYNLTAENRNAPPCLALGDLGVPINPTIPQGGFSYSINDYDGNTAATDMAISEIYDIGINTVGTQLNYHFLKHGFDARAWKHLILTRKFFESTPTYRRRDSSHTLYFFPKTQNAPNGVYLAGYAKFVRPAPYNSTLLIPKGTELTATNPASGSETAFRTTFETAYDITFSDGDAEIWVPIKAKNRTAPTGAMTTFNTPPSGAPAIPADMTVTNSNAMNLRGQVTISRSNASSIFVLSRYQVFRSSALTDSYEYFLTSDFIMPVGTTSMTVPVQKRIRNFDHNLSMNFVAGPPGGVAIVATTIQGLMDWNEAEIQRSPIYNGDLSYFKVRAIDGSNVAANRISIFESTAGSPAGEGGTLSVSHPTGMQVNGKLTITRNKTTSAWTLSTGTKVRTSNYTIYELAEDAVFAVGQASATVWIQRSGAYGNLNRVTSPKRNYAIPYFQSNSFNDGITLISAPTISATEGADLLNALIEVNETAEYPPNNSDMHDYWYPPDMFNFFAINNPTFPGNTPASVSNVKFCRLPVSNWTQTQSSSTCIPCNDLTSTTGRQLKSFFRSNKCYLNYKYNANDLSETFPIKVQVNEYSGDKDDFNTGESALTYLAASTFALNLRVIETNDAPVFTDSNFNAIAPPAGQDVNNPILLGTFNEGTSTSFPVYVLDTDRGSNLKKVGISIDSQVYDIKTSTWKELPDGMYAQTISEVDANSNGIGLKTTAQITWKPTDYQSKIFSGSQGFVIKVIAKDSLTTPNSSLTKIAYYKVILNNTNNNPTINKIGSSNSFRIFADKYFKTTISVEDPDFASPLGQSFNTRFSFCRDQNNNIVLHPTLDASAGSDPTTCHANPSTWPLLLTQYQSNYDDNTAESICRSNGLLNEDLAVPKISPLGPPTFSFTDAKYKQNFLLEWCPQKGHIGSYNITLMGSDNGDMDRDGALSAFLPTLAPLKVDVVAPVYFISPRNDINDVPVHHMKQTSAGITDGAFIYDPIVSNTLGNPLYFEILTAPRACSEANGVCINSATGRITWYAKHPTDININPGHKIAIKVTDTVTGDIDTAWFYLKVQNAVLEPEQAPSLLSSFPIDSNIQTSELKNVIFTATANDSNSSDILHYKWYVNETLVYDEGATFTYNVKDTFASLDPDGSGPRTYGEFLIRLEVTDGNYKVNRSWNLTIKNTTLVSDLIFDLTTMRPERLPAKTPVNINWIADLQLSKRTGNTYSESLVFTGNYELDTGIKHFLWNLPFASGNIVRQNLSRPPWNLIEDLPWQTGFKSERLSTNITGSGTDILVTSQASRGGPFGSTTEALRIPIDDWTNITLGSGNKCLGDCPTKMYTSSDSSGKRITTVVDGAYLIYASDDRKKLIHDYLSANTAQTAYDFGSQLISGIAYNENKKRIYVSLQGASDSKLAIFDSTNLSRGGSLSLVNIITLWDGVTGHENPKATDIVVSPVDNKAYLLLTATGGVAILNDSVTTPTSANVSFIGVNELGSSSSDTPGEGKKLVIDNTKKIIYGVMSDSKQVFTIDLASMEVQYTSTSEAIQSIQSYPSGMILLISRSKAQIFNSK